MQNLTLSMIFQNHQIEPDCLQDGIVDFCSSSRALIRLGYNLYNGYHPNFEHIKQQFVEFIEVAKSALEGKC